jgi:hypothetical protein
MIIVVCRVRVGQEPGHQNIYFPRGSAFFPLKNQIIQKAFGTKKYSVKNLQNEKKILMITVVCRFRVGQEPGHQNIYFPRGSAFFPLKNQIIQKAFETKKYIRKNLQNEKKY